MGSAAMTVVVMAPVMAPVMPIVVMVVMMSMVMMVAPMVPMMAVVSVMAMVAPMTPRPVSRHGGGCLVGILGHGGRVGGRLGGRGRRSHACRDGDEHQQPLEHETSSRVFCGTQRKAKERAMNLN
jgi:hypothetical protein